MLRTLSTMCRFSNLAAQIKFKPRSRRRPPSHFVWTILTAFILTCAARAQSVPSLLLDEDLPVASLLKSRPNNASKRSRLVRLNRGLLTGPPAQAFQPGGRFALNLFPDRQLNAVAVRTEQLGSNRSVIHGYIEAHEDSQFILAIDQDTMAASVSLPGLGSYTVTYGGDQVHLVSELDTSKLGVCGVGEEHGQTGVLNGMNNPSGVRLRNLNIFSSIAPEVGSTTNSVTIVDVMVVYTPEALAGAGSVPAMNTLIDLAMAEANTVYQNSQINARARLVYRGQVNYVEASSLATNLNRLQLRNDGFLDEVHLLRETNRADLVCLLTEHSDNGVAGLAFTMGEPSLQFADRAFCVVQRAQAVGSFIFAHELGHNFGCQHDRENAADETGSLKAGSFPYSYGHRFTAGATLYRTVMAYAPGEPIPYFSNPDILFKGVPTGLTGTTNGANNVRTINLTAAVVGSFYGPQVRTAQPTVTLNSPEPGAIITSGANLVLNVRAGDSDGPLRQVEFYADNTLLGVVPNSLLGLTNLLTGSTNAYSLTWTNVPSGEFRLTIRAVDLLGASVASPASHLIVRPFNDNFSGRSLINGAAPTVSGSNRAGTLEAGEAMHSGNPGGHSVWYSWTAPKAGTVVLTATGKGILPLAEVYQSISASALSSVTRRIDFDNTNLTVQATFDAAAGQSYQIAIDSLADSSGDFTFALAYIQAPDHDDFANRTALVGDLIDLQAVNFAATVEPGEKNHASNPGGKSVWYSWTAPKSRPAILSVTATNFFPLSDVYLGTSLPQITNAPQRVITFDQTNKTVTISFDAIAGQTYALAVDGFSGGSGVFHLLLQYPASPSNDDFSNRIALSGTAINLESANAYATREPGEPLHAGQASGKASVWYSWSAPVSGPVIVTARGTGFYPLPDVFTGSAIGALTNVLGRSITFDKTNPVSTLVFDAVAFRTYALALDGFNGMSGKISFSLMTANVPPTVRLFDTLSQTNASFRLRLFGSAGQRVVVQASADLQAWTNVFGGTFVTNTLPFTDENSRGFPYRFYRALPLP
jgi:hypothetical protein